MYLARLFDLPLQAVAVYDPYLHYSIFHSIADVLSDEASQVFKFKEQEQLHEEVIDTGLARIYQSHLEVGKRLAEAEGLDMDTTLLPGKPFEKILQFVGKESAWLLICGRIGVHSEQDMDIGSNSENLLRLAPCNVLLASGRFVPPVDLKAEEAVHWTDEAVQRMGKAPSFVQGVARQAVLRWAMERGHSVITSGVIDQALGDVLPPGAAAAMGTAAKLAEQTLAEEASFVCRNCGHAVRRDRPATCTVCGRGPETFEQLDKDAIASRAREEGDVRAEQTFDGVRLMWSREARSALRRLPAGFPRRSARARVEKAAKMRKLDTITSEFVAEVVEDEGAGPSETVPRRNPSAETQSVSKPAVSDDEFVVEGSMRWTPASVERLQRVPEGFMRDLTRKSIEAYAQETGAADVDLEVAEQGIDRSRKSMAASIARYGSRGDRNAAANCDALSGDAAKGSES
jgi:nucleotide-binding universal stress UspA family protein